MAGERREATFQQLLDEGLLEIGDGYRAQNNELGGTGPIFLRAGHVTDSHIDFAGVEHFHEHLADKVRSKMSKVGDTIITTKGNSTGRTSFVTDRLPPFVYSPHLSYWRSRDPEKLCGGFLRYWSQGVEFIEQLSGMKASTDMAPYLSLTDQRRLSITLPPLAEQKAIAAVLGALDDKIELNRRMNATLEAMARALFQSWFVDFDPVRAKLDGRPPAALDPATAAIFPHRSKNPRSDQSHMDGERRTLKKSQVSAAENAPRGRCDVLSPECNIPLYGGGGRMGYVPSALYDKPILFTGRVGTLGLIFRTAEPSWPSDNTLIVEPQAGLFDFTYFVLKGFDLITLNRGSTQPLLTQTDLKRQPFVLPTKVVVRAFAEASEPIFRQIVANERESHTLATLRDTLLPKLLSGELSVAGGNSPEFPDSSNQRRQKQ